MNMVCLEKRMMNKKLVIIGGGAAGMMAAIAAAETDETDKPVKDITIESITFESYAAK